MLIYMYCAITVFQPELCLFVLHLKRQAGHYLSLFFTNWNKLVNFRVVATCMRLCAVTNALYQCSEIYRIFEAI